MANYAIDGTLIKPSAQARLEILIAGAAIAAGDAIYKDANGKAQLSDANGATAAQEIHALATHAAAVDQRVIVVRKDPALVIGATTTQVMASGDVLVLSTTPGKLQPAPATAASRAVVAGVATSNTVVNLQPLVGGTVP